MPAIGGTADVVVAPPGPPSGVAVAWSVGEGRGVLLAVGGRGVWVDVAVGAGVVAVGVAVFVRALVKEQPMPAAKRAINASPRKTAVLFNIVDLQFRDKRFPADSLQPEIATRMIYFILIT